MIECSKCKSPDVKKHAVRKNNSGEKEVFKCNECSGFFTPDDGFNRFRHSRDEIEIALKMRENDYSLAEVVEYLKDLYGLEVTRQSILYWERKFKEKNQR